MKRQPDKIGHYSIIEELGRGGMGIVYHAVHEKTKKHVAVKTIHLKSKNLISLVRREIRALIRVQHPGVIRVFDEGLIRDTPWFSMELLTGKNLLDYCQDLARELNMRGTGKRKSRRKIHPDYLTKILEIGIRITDALAFLHGENILHGDLKPSNILITDEGFPKLVDFGLTITGNTEITRESLQIEDTVIGTLHYMAPELLRCERVDARIDLYSFGCILFELLTGQIPFNEKSMYDIISAKLVKNPPRLTHFVTSLPLDLDRLIANLLASEPRKRPGYAIDVGNELMYIHSKADRDVARHVMPKPYLYRPSLVGRQSQLTILNRLLNRLIKGQGSCVLLSGEAGIGKTRLALEIRRIASLKSIQVLTGECQVDDEDMLNVFRQPLRSIVEKCKTKNNNVAKKIFGNRAKVLSQLVPEINELHTIEGDEEPIALPDPAAKLRLFSFLLDTFTAMTEDGPLLLIIDDLHWADERTIEFFNFMVSSSTLDSKPVLLLGSFRSEEAQDQLAEIISHEKVRLLELKRLTSQDIVTIISDMLALQKAPTSLCSHLEKHTEGNPFFVSEYILSALNEQILIRDEAGVWKISYKQQLYELNEATATFPLPTSLQEMVKKRLSKLPIKAHSVTNIMSLIGHDVDFGLLLCCLPFKEEELLDSCEILISMNFLRYTRPDVLQFSHNLFREVTVELFDPDERRKLHSDIACGFEKYYADDLDAQLGYIARHWEQAGEIDKAIMYYLQAARADVSRYDHHRAETNYYHYLRLNKLPSSNRLMALREYIVDVLFFQGRNHEALTELNNAFLESKQLNQKNYEIQFLMWQGILFYKTGNLNKAEKILPTVIEALRKNDDHVNLGTALRNLATLRFQQGQIDLALQLIEEALLHHQISGDREAEGVTFGDIASLFLQRGQYDRGKQFLEKALEIQREVGDRRAEGISLTNLAILAQNQNQLDLALHYCQEAIKIQRDIGDRRAEGKALDVLATGYLFEGKLDQAQELYNKSRMIHNWIGDNRSEWLALVNLANINRWLGNHKEAEKLLDEAETIVSAVQDTILHALVLCYKGYLRLAIKRPVKRIVNRCQKIVEQLNLSKESQLSRTVDDLVAAQMAFSEKRRELLYQGERLDRMPDTIRNWLIDQGKILHK